MAWIFRRLAEAGQLKVDPEPTEVKVELRGTRLTIRFTENEIQAIDQEAQRQGVGRSTLVRTLVRVGLEDRLSHGQATSRQMRKATRGRAYARRKLRKEDLETQRRDPEQVTLGIARRSVLTHEP